MDTVSNGGFLQFSAGGILSPVAGRSGAQLRPLRLRRPAQPHCAVCLPIADQGASHRLGYALNGWQVSGTAFWHSGIPFSVLSTPYSANGNGIVQGSGPQFASVVPGVPLYEHNPIPGSRSPARFSGSTRMPLFRPLIPAPALAPAATVPRIANSAIWDATRLRGPDFIWSDFYLTKWFPFDRTPEAADGSPVLQSVQSSEFWASRAWCSPAFPASRPPRRDLARSPTPPRLPPACWGLGWAATAHHA